MRTGEPIAMQEVKARARREMQGASTAHYIWRTQGDGKVRASHRANDGKIFPWDDPPPTGHPGEDYGCRCRAEAYEPEVSEFARQTLTSTVNDTGKKWDTFDFSWHFLTGGGAAVTLQEIGFLQDVIDLCAENRYSALNQQIKDAGREAGPGRFSHDFNRSYDFFGAIHPVFGGGTVSGEFKGAATLDDTILIISRTVEYHFSDEFTDPLDFRQILLGSSSPDEVDRFIAKIVRKTPSLVSPLFSILIDALESYTDEFFVKTPSVNALLNGLSLARDLGVDVAGDILVRITDGVITERFPITGSWQTEFEACVLAAQK